MLAPEPESVVWTPLPERDEQSRPETGVPPLAARVAAPAPRPAAAPGMPASAAAGRSASAPEKILQRLEWKVIRRLDGVLQGDYRSLFRGNGVDLVDLREYQPGDDVRAIEAFLQHPDTELLERNLGIARLHFNVATLAPAAALALAIPLFD